MRYRISEIKLDIGEKEERIGKKIEKKIGAKISNMEIIRESVDARKKPDLKFVYTVDFDCDRKLNLPLSDMKPYIQPKAKEKKNVTVIGFGPSGMFASLILQRAGMNVTVLERGLDVDSRTELVKKFWDTHKLDRNTNVQFGEGGAGTFSDGKLTTGIKDDRIRFVLKEFVKYGADPAIMYKGKPHIGTDVLCTVVKNLREEVISLGGKVKFGCLADGVEIKDGKIVSVHYMNHMEGYTDSVACDAVVLAMGHSSRDTFRMLKELNIPMERKPFSIGFRIEHPQDMIDISQYGKTSRELGIEPAAYKLSTRVKDERGVYTFCMCPGGYVVNASSEDGMLCVNGMSEHNRDSGTANSAVLCDVRTDDFEGDDVLSGVYFQEKYEHLAFVAGGSDYSIPVSDVGTFLSGKAENIESCLPDFAVRSIKEALPVFGRKIKGFDRPDAVIKGIESRSSSPVRVLRNENYVSEVSNLYPAGEGCGYAGGIMSSAVDGIRTAEKICEV
ncbi:MAG: NAD(FAD)-utilizing dehydrogenase [Clostridia bacterium]|nr:NAD(FAD)-utilizing dehydrogenase [Clostridia bacterium]